jgi:pimeloyl-ACP methyl ester carboxylesterase
MVIDSFDRPSQRVFGSQASLARDEVLVVANQNLHIETLGSGGPTVVFEAGLGNDSTTWKYVAGTIATFAQAVVYDRAGLGQSLPMIATDSSVTADKVTAALHALLADAAIRPPYILVGHSLGGLYMQRFAIRYPAEASGLVLIDSYIDRPDIVIDAVRRMAKAPEVKQ